MKKPELKIDKYGNKFWILNEKRHRVNGPAVEYPNGTKFWYLNDKLHRIDGPAVEWFDGDKEWWLNGKCHRINGPAIECSNGDKEWYLNGKKVKKEDVISCSLTEREYIKFVMSL